MWEGRSLLQKHPAEQCMGPAQLTDLSQERGIDTQVLGDQVEAEEVSVDASAGHGQAVHVLVLLRSLPKEILEVGFLRIKKG